MIQTLFIQRTLNFLRLVHFLLGVIHSIDRTGQSIPLNLFSGLKKVVKMSEERPRIHCRVDRASRFLSASQSHSFIIIQIESPVSPKHLSVEDDSINTDAGLLSLSTDNRIEGSCQHVFLMKRFLMKSKSSTMRLGNECG
jgi:hypothetical protein